MLKYGLLFVLSLFFANHWSLLILFIMLASLMFFMLEGSYNLGLIEWMMVDNISFMLIFLSFWVTFLMLMMSNYIKENNDSYFVFVILVMLMMILLTCTFFTSNMMLFYIMFEGTLIPIFLLVMGWGYQPERLKASYYLLFYTLFASLPLLLGILWVYFNYGSLMFGMLNLFLNWPLMLFLMMTLAFLVKMPVYFFHLWLPKAHVEAPVAGSMILAGILLKLGGYGMYRAWMFLVNPLVSSASFLMCLGLLGGVFSSLICLRQTDSKSLVAYSSVAHMALVLLGFTVGSLSGALGAIIIMIAHGLCSSGLFALVGMSYSRVGTRSILLMRGALTLSPLFGFWWFVFSIANMAAPPTPNLAAEIYVFISSLAWWQLSVLFLGLMSFLGAAYNLYLFSGIQHGAMNLNTSFVGEATLSEHLVLFFHFCPLLLSLAYLMNLA